MHSDGAAFGLLASLALLAQDLPDQLSFKPGENQYCRATFTDLKGAKFDGVVRASIEDETMTFQVYEEHAEYKADTDEKAFEYAPKRRATITIKGRSVDAGDIIVIDGAVHFVTLEKPAPPEAVTFVNDVAACLANNKT